MKKSISNTSSQEDLDRFFEDVYDEAFTRYEGAPRGSKSGDQNLRMEYSKFRKDGKYPKFRQSIKAALAEGAKVSVTITFPKE